MKKLDIFFIFMLISMLAMVSCDDHQVAEPELDEVVVRDIILTSRIGSDLFVDLQQSRLKNTSNSCFTLSSEVMEDEKKLKLSIKYNNCEEDGIVKNGEIQVLLAAPSERGNAKTEIEFINFTVNKDEINGKMSIEAPAITAKSASIKTEADLQVKYVDGSSTSWNGKFEIKMLENGTFQMDGTSTGKARNGKSFVAKEVGMIRKLDCSWYVGGKMEVVFDQKDDYKIEFESKCGEIHYTHKGIRAKLNLD